MHWTERPQAPRNSYPSGDGRPFSESDFHYDAMVGLLDVLDRRYEDDPSVYVSGNLLIYYQKGNRYRRIAPDVFVVFGVPKMMRHNYLLWEEGRGPNVVIEVTHSRTRHEDTVRKFKLYRDVLRVPEYFLFDPLDHHLAPRLQGYRLVRGEYRPMRLHNGRLRSRKLDLWLEPEGTDLRLFDPATGRRLATTAEEIDAAEAARTAFAAETARIRARTARLQAENERLRVEIAAIRKWPGGRNGHGPRPS